MSVPWLFHKMPFIEERESNYYGALRILISFLRLEYIDSNRDGSSFSYLHDARQYLRKYLIYLLLTLTLAYLNLVGSFYQN